MLVSPRKWQLKFYRVSWKGRYHLAALGIREGVKGYCFNTEFKGQLHFRPAQNDDAQREALVGIAVGSSLFSGLIEDNDR